MKITTTTVPVKVIQQVTMVEQQKRFILELDVAEARALKRLANCNLTLPSIMSKHHARDMEGVEEFLTNAYNALDAQKVQSA